MKQFFTYKILTMLSWAIMLLLSLAMSIYNQDKHNHAMAYDVASAN